MKEGLLGGTLSGLARSELEEARVRVVRWIGSESQKLDVCLLSGQAEIVEEFAAPPDVDGLRALARRVAWRHEPVRGVIESMTAARFVHDKLEELGWDVLIGMC